MHLIKWSVRGVDHEAIDKLLEVQETSEGLLLGELVSLAIHDWYSHLPEESEDESPISPTWVFWSFRSSALVLSDPRFRFYSIT